MALLYLDAAKESDLVGQYALAKDQEVVGALLELSQSYPLTDKNRFS